MERPFLREIILLGYGTMIGKQCSQQAACPVEFIQVLALFIPVNATNAVNLSNHFSFSVHPQPSV